MGFVHKEMGPLLSTLAIFGLFCPKPLFGHVSVFRQRLQILYSVLCNAFYWSTFVRFMFCFQSVTIIDGTLFLNASYALYLAAFLFAITAFTISAHTGLPVFMEALQRLYDKYGRPEYFIKHRNKCGVIVLTEIVCSFCGILLVTFVQVSSEEVKSGRHCIMLPFRISDTTAYYSFAAVYIATEALSTVGFTVLSLTLFITFYIVYKEFDIVEQKFRNLQTVVKDNYRDAESARLHYEDVVNLLHKANRLCSPFVIAQFGVVIPCLCLNIYALATETYSEKTVALLISHALMLTISVVLIIGLGILVNSKAHGLVDFVLQIDFNELSDGTVRSLMVFLRRLTGTSVGISAGGLFIVDKSTLLTMIGGLVTYVVVVFQFKPSTPEPLLIELALNGTEA